MAMSLNDSGSTTRRSASRRPANNNNPVVPSASRAATARKLEPEVLAPEIDELDFPAEAPAKSDRQTEAQRQEQMKLVAKLVEKRDEYVERLDVGAAKIEEARSQGKDVSTWEDYWIQLLHQYEAVCDKLRDLQAGL